MTPCIPEGALSNQDTISMRTMQKVVSCNEINECIQEAKADQTEIDEEEEYIAPMLTTGEEHIIPK